MGLFDIFKKAEQPKEAQHDKTILAMVLFKNGEKPAINSVLNHLKNSWSLKVGEVEGKDETSVFKIEDEMIALAYLPAPIPGDEVTNAARYAYNWQTAMEDLKGYDGHCIVSILSGKKTTVERFKLLSKVLSSILTSSNAVGVYKGTQSLLISKDQYLEMVETLRANKIPVNLWIYIGARKSDAGNSFYTYGLSEFGKQEMEVVNSKLSFDDVYVFLATICAYVIGGDITFKSGETLGYTNDQKIKITSSKGVFVGGNSLKLEI